MPINKDVQGVSVEAIATKSPKTGKYSVDITMKTVTWNGELGGWMVDGQHEGGFDDYEAGRVELDHAIKQAVRAVMEQPAE